MKKILLIGSVLLILSLLTGDENRVIRIINPTTETLNLVRDYNLDMLGFSFQEYLDIAGNNATEELLQRYALDFFTHQTRDDILNKLNYDTRDEPHYRSYNQILNQLNSITENYPEISQLYNVGDSWGKIYHNEGYNYYQDFHHDIWALRLTSGVAELSEKPALLFIGASHAREPLSAEMPLFIAEYIVDGYAENDPDIITILENIEIWLVPLQNPDGHKIVLDQTDIWWRKNIRDNNNNRVFDSNYTTGTGLDGVDLNRNSGFQWAPSGTINSATYSGPYAFSEPEIAFSSEIVDLAHFLAGFSYHTHGQYVLWPLGYTYNIINPDEEAMAALGISTAQAIPRFMGSGNYTPMPAWQFYPATGTQSDYFYGVHGIFLYTVEMATTFIPNPIHIQSICEDNMNGVLVMIDRLSNSMLTGNIYDALTLEPLQAEIFVSGIDDTGVFRHPYTSSEQFGRYYRLIEPGFYNVTFSKNGYQDETFNDVQISSDFVTEQNVYLIEENYEIVYGDVLFDGLVTPYDASLVLKHSVGLNPIPEAPFPWQGIRFFAADVDQDNQITAYDASLILQYYVGLLDSLPVNELSVEPPSSIHTYHDSRNLYFEAGDNVYSFEITLPRTIIDFEIPQVCETLFHEYNLNSDYVKVSIAGYNSISTNGYFLKIPYSNTTENTHVTLEADIRLNRTPKTLVLDFCNLSNENQSHGDVSTYSLYPNPARKSINLSFSLEKDSNLKIKVYNIKGQLITNLNSSLLRKGSHSISWNLNDHSNRPVPSGVYFFKMENAKGSELIRFVVVK